MFGFLHNNPEVVLEFPGNQKLMDQIQSYIPKPDMLAYYRSDTISGHVTVTPPPGKIVSHRNINLILFGEYRDDTNKPISRFFQRTQCLMPIGDLTTELSTDFTFEHINLPTNTYYGTCVNVIFGVELRVIHRLSDFVYERQFIALSYSPYPLKTSIHNEIGIKNILHIEFVFPKQAYDAREPVVGAAYFILVKLRIVFMKIGLYRNEEYESENNFFKKKTVLKTYDILDGAPVRGDHTPIRFFMGDVNIWPFVSYHGAPLTVEHYLRVEMIDENGKKYFKRLKVYFNRFRPEEENDEEGETTKLEDEE